MDGIAPDVYAKQKSNAQLMAMQSIDSLIDANYRPYDQIVDIGCGDGDITKHFLGKHLPHKHILAIDIVPDMISYARSHNHSDDNTIEYLLQDMSIEWPELCPRVRELDGKVDLIFSNFTLSYMPDKWRTVGIFRRLLSTGGIFHANIFIIGDLNKKLVTNGQQPGKWYQSREKQLDDWRQSLLSDNQFLVKQFDIIDVIWPTDRQKMIDFMPIIVSKVRPFFKDDQSAYDRELNDHLWDTAFDTVVNPMATEPNPGAWKRFLADPTIREVNRHHRLLRVTAIKQ
ncbi:uncharacterized protein LOC128954140 [Oppia nitens]|uniref:uncharacterized protein LOC128954140 n=1 Tax=Oppia nitens TaxID=1686743 RepID=UPI0023DAC802|nr:uncharacterized protein LOC128954140 [Oppia nitens]